MAPLRPATGKARPLWTCMGSGGWVGGGGWGVGMTPGWEGRRLSMIRHHIQKPPVPSSSFFSPTALSSITPGRDTTAPCTPAIQRRRGCATWCRNARQPKCKIKRKTSKEKHGPCLPLHSRVSLISFPLLLLLPTHPPTHLPSHALMQLILELLVQLPDMILSEDRLQKGRWTKQFAR